MNSISLPTNLSRFFPRSSIGGKIFHAGLTAVACALALSVPASAQFHDDFESYGDWVSLAEPWVTVNKTGSIWVVADYADLFGDGTSNKIVDYTKYEGEAQAMIVQNIFSVEIGRIGFDFVRPADGSTDSLSIILNAGSRSDSTNRAMQFTIGNENIGGAAYERGTANRVEIVFNNGNYPVLYGDDYLLYPGTADIWVNGERGSFGFTSNNNQRGPVRTFEFNSASGTTHQFYFDNIAIEAIDWESAPSLAFFDDFESHTDFGPPQSPWKPDLSSGGGSISVDADDSDLFGRGSDNRILNYSKTGDSGSQALILQNEFAAEVGRVSFDMVRPWDGSEDRLWFIMNVGPRTGTAHRAQVITIDNEAINGAGYERGAVNHVELVFNNSNETVLYGEGNRIPAGTTDIWINGELKTAGFASQNNRRGAVTTFEFNSAGDRTHQFYFDNIAFEPIEWEIAPPQIIFHDDFSSHVAGTTPDEPWTSVTDNPQITGSVLIQKDIENRFGKGADNQYLEYIANGDGAIVARSQNTFSSDLITFSVRLITPTPVGELGYSWFIFNVGNASGSNNRAQVFTLDNRISTTFPEAGSRIGGREYPQNVPVQIDLVINNRSASVEYGDGQIIESGTTDIWIDGVLARAGFASQNNKLGPISTFELNVDGRAKQHLLVDEITIWDTARISGEPSLPESGFADWRRTHFPDDAENDEISGPAANPSGDGVSNLIKYALGLDPNIASRQGLPVSGTQEIEGADYLILTFQRPVDRDDVERTVLATGDLFSWETEAIQVETFDNGDGSVTEIWRDVESIEESGARFLRLEVSLD